MKKGRFIYFICSLLIMALLLTLSIYYPEDGRITFITYLLIIVFIFSNYMKKKREIEEVRNIVIEYLNTCDVDKYLDSLTKFYKQCIFFSKKQKMSFDLYFVQGYLDAGLVKESEEKLLEIDKKVNDFNEITKFVYLKTWCDYFFITNKDEKMKYTMVKIRDLMASMKNFNLKMNCNFAYQVIVAKYMLITKNGDLKFVRDSLTNHYKIEPQAKSKLVLKYLLALLDLKESKYEEAISKLKDVINVAKNKSLYVYKEAKSILEEYNKINNKVII